MTAGATTSFGKFRGTVVNTQDPQQRGRIQAHVPALAGREMTSWALPCAPAQFFAVPVVGAGVWIEFEEGDPSLPVWTGCRWGSAAELPSTRFSPPPQKVLDDLMPGPILHAVRPCCAPTAAAPPPPCPPRGCG